jgi:hypothetical protein
VARPFYFLPVNSILHQQPHPHRGYWFCQIAGWSLYGAANAAAAALFGGVPWLRALVQMAVLAAMGLGLSHLLWLVIRRRRWNCLRWTARTQRLIVASLLLGAVAGLLERLLGLAEWQAQGFSIETISMQHLALFLAQCANWILLFGVWTATYVAVQYIRARRSAELRESELARALQTSELRLLKSQLNPHFLFNALNTVRALIADDPARAQSAVTQLARTLRYTLQSGQDELVRLDEELDIVDDYLELEALRLGERLRVERDIAPEARSIRIPVMLLQTLVENALKHGISELPAGGVLRIYASVAQRVLTLEVKNARPEHPAAPTRGGIGIDNAQRRIRLLFGPEATLDLDLSRPAWALARVRLPVGL